VDLEILKMWWKRAEKSPQDSSRPLVALIDDDGDLCTVMGCHLEPLGYETAAAYDGESGLELIRARRPAAVVLDMVMPRMNGLQVLAHLQSEPELASIPVVVVTSLTDGPHQDQEWKRKLGVERFISKPCDPGVIVRAVQELLAATAGEALAEESPA
jgi:CheY-like chemotaxis protein